MHGKDINFVTKINSMFLKCDDVCFVRVNLRTNINTKLSNFACFYLFSTWTYLLLTLKFLFHFVSVPKLTMQHQIVNIIQHNFIK